MDDSIYDFLAPNVPENERLENYRALGHGLVTSLDYFLNRLDTYHDLLELELEDAPGGEMYLKEANASLRRALSLVRAWLPKADHPSAKEGFESFDLTLFAKGAISRMEKLARGDVALDLSGLEKNEAFIKGRLFACQQLFFELPLVVKANGEPQTLSLSRVHLDNPFFINRKSRLRGGDYFSVTLARGEIPEHNDWISFTERLMTSPELELSGRLLFLSGVVMEHGGDLFASKGTDGELDALMFVLPAQQNKVDMYTDSTMDEFTLRGDETVLLVDDEAIIWDVVIDMLQGMGYTVILAADGRDCVEIYSENPGEIDVVLLDMVMPEMNGKEAFFALKEIDPNVRVLLQSGYIQEEDARDVLDAGAKGFLRKPYRMRQLAKHIRTIIDAG